MAFCSMCGAQIADGATTCAACAGRTATTAAATPTGGIADNAAGMLAYVTIFGGIIMLLIDPYNKSRFVRFHAWQSIFFNLAWIVLWVVLRMTAHIPLIGWITVFLIDPLVVLGGFIVWLILVLKANQGQMFKLPVVGDLAEKQAFTM